MLLGALGASSLGTLSLVYYLLIDKVTIRAGEGKIKAGKNAASSFNKFWNTKVSSKWT